jgi:hypothetical protein
MAGESHSKKRKTIDSGADDYPPDVEVLMDRVVKHGLPCHIVAVAEEHGFFMLKLKPLEGWQHIATPEAVARETDKGWAPHISLGWNLEAETWAKVVELWQKHPEVLERWRAKFRYVLVDEYQDTNPAQYALVKLLCDHGERNLAVVGDDDQSIYSFRGADIQNILDFEKDFPSATVVRLEQNYRSTQTILDAASALVKRNTQRKDKTLWTDADRGTPIRVLRAEDENDEAQRVVADARCVVAAVFLPYFDVSAFRKNGIEVRGYHQFRSAAAAGADADDVAFLVDVGLR